MDHLETRLGQMERILEISRDLASTISPERLLQHIVETAVELTDTESASILLFDEPSGELRFMAAARSADQLVPIAVPIEQSLAGVCFATGEPLIVPDVGQDPRYYKEVEKQTGFEVRSLLAVPLQYRERRIGVLEVSNKRGDPGFGQEDMDILAVLAAQATITIENTRMVEALQQHHDHLEQLVVARVLEITRISAQLDQETSERQRAEAELRHIREVASAASRTSGDILIVDDAPANLRLLMEILAEHGHRVRAVLDGAHALAAAQAAPPDLILLDVVMPDMDGYEVCRRLKADERTQDIPILFLSALGETEGKIHAFTAGGVDYITKPFQVAELLARVQTHLSLRHLHTQLQAANAELIDQLQELEVRNKELDAYARTVAHDIKNPLSLIVGYTTFLLQSYGTLSEEDRNITLQTLERVSNDLINVVNGLLLLARVRNEDVLLEPLDMACLVDSALNRLAGLIEESLAQVSLPASWPEAWGYGVWVAEVWINYLSNGCRYGGPSPRLELGADDPVNGQVRFWLRDYGPGISPADQARLFTPFTQLGRARGGGHGLGLSIVQRIVTKLGGQVGVESDGLPGQGSLFFFTLPVEPPESQAQGC
jgi:two-component system sensor histidine kinase/response regulator